MVVIGVDAHKRSHTLVAADELGRKLGERTVGTTSDGHLQAVQWAAQWPQVRLALEDCRHLTRRLEGDLGITAWWAARILTTTIQAAFPSLRHSLRTLLDTATHPTPPPT